MNEREELQVPIHLKLTLTIKEAAEYSSIGINKIDSMLKQPNCPFVLYVGTHILKTGKAGRLTRSYVPIGGVKIGRQSKKFLVDTLPYLWWKNKDKSV